MFPSWFTEWTAGQDNGVKHKSWPCQSTHESLWEVQRRCFRQITSPLTQSDFVDTPVEGSSMEMVLGQISGVGSLYVLYSSRFFSGSHVKLSGWQIIGTEKRTDHEAVITNGTTMKTQKHTHADIKIIQEQELFFTQTDEMRYWLASLLYLSHTFSRHTLSLSR